MATRPYQGFPYTQPYVVDAPSIDAATASRWNNLPRRPIRPDLPSNVVYVNLPEEGSQVSTPNTPSPDKKEELDDLDARPVIYIDVPEGTDSDVAGPASPEPEPEYVQETIFYDPFENRRIDHPKDLASPGSEASSSSSRTGRPAPQRPPPPNTLSLTSASSSGHASYSAALPASFSKEASIYGRSDDFAMSPLPASEFPEPPPAYSEIAPAQPTPERQTTPEAPRTVVINQGERPDASPIGLPNPTRKVVHCQHCGQRVHTLVIWENGPITHILALMLMCLMLIPLVILVYWTNVCKYKNHYCPNCNKKIGYEFPLFCLSITYTSDS